MTKFNKKQHAERDDQEEKFIKWFNNNYMISNDDIYDKEKKKYEGIRRRNIIDKYKLIDPKFTSHQYTKILINKMCLPHISESTFCSMLFFIKEKV